MKSKLSYVLWFCLVLYGSSLYAKSSSMLDRETGTRTSLRHTGAQAAFGNAARALPVSEGSALLLFGGVLLFAGKMGRSTTVATKSKQRTNTEEKPVDGYAIGEQRPAMPARG